MLALIHGPTGCAAEWNPLRAHLPPSLRLNCYAPELDYMEQTPLQIAAELRAHLTPRKPQRLVIAAHGLGSLVALHLSEMAHETVLVAPPLWADGALIPTHPETGEIWIDGLAHRPERIPYFDFHRMVAMQRLGALLSDSADPAVLARLRSAAAGLANDPTLEREDVSLVIGTEDRVAAPQDWAARAPQGRVHVLPDAGHLLHLEVPQSLARVLGRAHGVVSPLTRAPAEVCIAS